MPAMATFPKVALVLGHRRAPAPRLGLGLLVLLQVGWQQGIWALEAGTWALPMPGSLWPQPRTLAQR